MLDDFLKRADPPAEARITYGARQGHCWSILTEGQMMEEMFVAVEQSKPRRSALWEEQKSVEVVGRPSGTDYGGRTAVHGSVSAAWATTQ